MRVWKPRVRVQDLAFSPDGRTVATASGSSPFVALWDCATGTEVKRFGCAGGGVRAFEFAPGGEHLAVLADRGGISVWELASDGTAPVAVLQPTKQGLWVPVALAFVPTSGRLVAASSTALDWWDEPTGPSPVGRAPSGRRVTTLAQGSYALRFTPDGTRLLIGRGDLEICVGEVYDHVATVPTNKGGGLRSIAVSPDGMRAACRLKNTVRVCRLDPLAWETTLHWGRATVTAVAFSRDGQTLITADADGAVRYWAVGTWQESNRFDWGIGRITALAVAPDGLTCAAAGNKGRVVIWDLDG
jgi:WD40 repeat protein